MTKLLRIDASARLEGAHSRALGDFYEENWRGENPSVEISRRDLVTNAVDHIEQLTIAGFYTPPADMTAELRAATAKSDELIAELQAADELLITTPMYNFSIPSALKAWIDQVVRIGHTFSYDGESFGGLVHANKATVICAYGAAGYLDGEGFRAANFLEPYLQFLLGFLGVQDVRFISLQATTADEATVQAALEKARSDIATLLKV